MAFTKKLIITVYLLLIFSSPLVYADERILSYHSDIRVNPNGSLLVEETIQVKAEGREIKRGIYRDFPTRYKDAYGNKYVVDFSLLSIYRDGKPESYHTKNTSDGIRIYIGQEHVFLTPNVYRYTIIYSTDRQLGFFKEHDELYWNVTGNYWSFPIDRASAVIHLPGDSRHYIRLIDGFTGPLGARGKDFHISYDRHFNPVFETTRILGVGEGLTIVVGWNKGFVASPSEQTKAMYFIADNRETIISFFGFCFILGYYLLSWLKVGKDPEKNSIFPIYEPPKGYSPASMRYIYKMGYDVKSFAAAIINMAVKGTVTLQAKGGIEGYDIQKTGSNTENLTPDERLIFASLFGSRGSFSFDATNSKTIKETIAKFNTSLQTAYEKIYFFSNKGYFITGLIGSFAVVAASIFLSRLQEETIFLGIWLTFWSIGVIFLLLQLIKTWRAFRYASNKTTSFFRSVFFSVFCLPFIAAEIAVFIILIKNTSFLFGAILIAIGSVNYLFYHLLKSPTLRGRRLMDRIEGFRLFLDATEKDRLNMLHAPDRTPEMFEKYLPYAVALDVENKWAEQFESILQTTDVEGRKGYTPRWYSGAFGRDASFAFIGSSIGEAVAASISSAASPGSSSGSGGSSGGGGGGGGGGGW